MSPDKKYMTIEEVAELLGVTYQLIYRLVRSGELPAVRVGRVYRITGADLDLYLETTKMAGSAPAMVCTGCGKTYRSRLSLAAECMECGAPICVDCWERKGERYCAEHADDASEKSRKRAEKKNKKGGR